MSKLDEVFNTEKTPSNKNSYIEKRSFKGWLKRKIKTINILILVLFFVISLIYGVIQVELWIFNKIPVIFVLYTSYQMAAFIPFVIKMIPKIKAIVKGLTQ